jgi:hypothetical protein
MILLNVLLEASIHCAPTKVQAVGDLWRRPGDTRFFEDIEGSS